MADTNQNEFLFTLSKLTTEQFAVFEENYSMGMELEMNIQCKFGADPSKKMLGIFFQFNLRSAETQKEVLIIESGTHFQVELNSWNNFLKENVLTIPYIYTSHFAAIAIGNTRGMLHSKTEGTSLNHLFLPLMTTDKIIDENDLVIEFTQELKKET